MAPDPRILAPNTALPLTRSAPRRSPLSFNPIGECDQVPTFAQLAALSCLILLLGCQASPAPRDSSSLDLNVALESLSGDWDGTRIELRNSPNCPLMGPEGSTGRLTREVSLLVSVTPDGHLKARERKRTSPEFWSPTWDGKVSPGFQVSLSRITPPACPGEPNSSGDLPSWTLTPRNPSLWRLDGGERQPHHGRA
jgi:hypothetical protein